MREAVDRREEDARPMSQLVVITFDDTEQAGQALGSIRQVEKAGQLKIKDTAVVVKDAEGKVHTRNEVSGATETGAVVGGVIGGLVTFFFPPVGAALGAAGGAAVGALMNEGVDGNFVREVQEDLKPGSSALFIVAGDGRFDAGISALEPYRGTLRQTSLDSETEEALRRALE
jgi:uncharacterized membrane protein